MMQSIRKNPGITVFSVLMLLQFMAAAPASAADGAKIKATVIIASHEGGENLLDGYAYADQLKSLFSYSSYRRVGADAFTLARSERRTIDLAQGYELVLTLQAIEEKRILLQAVIRKDDTVFLDTVAAVQKPGVVFLG